MQKVVRLICDWLWPFALAVAALLGLLHARGYRQLACLPADVQIKSPDIGYLLSSNEVSAYLLFGLAWGALIQQMLLAASGRAAPEAKRLTLSLWGWLVLATLCAGYFALQQC